MLRKTYAIGSQNIKFDNIDNVGIVNQSYWYQSLSKKNGMYNIPKMVFARKLKKNHTWNRKWGSPEIGIIIISRTIKDNKIPWSGNSTNNKIFFRFKIKKERIRNT